MGMKKCWSIIIRDADFYFRLCAQASQVISESIRDFMRHVFCHYQIASINKLPKVFGPQFALLAEQGQNRNAVVPYSSESHVEGRLAL